MAVGLASILWQGFTGAPGYTTLAFGPGAPDPVDGEGMVLAADNFAAAIAPLLGTGMTVTASPEINWYDEVTGDLIDVTAVDPPPSPHTGSPSFVGPTSVGLVISWTTAGINRGHKVRGRTFIVPINHDAFQSDGTPSSAAITGAAAAASGLAGSPDATFGIWSRPVDHAGGKWFPVTTWRVPDMGAVLRSRRD